MQHNLEFFQKTIGWFDDGGQEEPTHDPAIGVGLCLLCEEVVTHPMKTSSIKSVNGRRSYFYRTHRACFEADKPNAENMTQADDKAFNLIEQFGMEITTVQ